MKSREHLLLEAEVETLRSQLVAMDAAMCTESPRRELETAVRQLAVVLREGIDSAWNVPTDRDRIRHFIDYAAVLLSAPGIRKFLEDRCPARYEHRLCVLQKGHGPIRPDAPADSHLDARGGWKPPEKPKRKTQPVDPPAGAPAP